MLEKLRIVEETCLPGARVTTIARAHAISSHELVKWREVVQRSLPPHTESAAGPALASSVEELSRQVDQLRKQLTEITLENALLRLQLEVIRAGSVATTDDKRSRVITQLSLD